MLSSISRPLLLDMWLGQILPVDIYADMCPSEVNAAESWILPNWGGVCDELFSVKLFGNGTHCEKCNTNKNDLTY